VQSLVELAGEVSLVAGYLLQGLLVGLEARNGAHEDIVVPAERVVVQGTVEWVIRRVRGRR
jgi:hypothetical protein